MRGQYVERWRNDRIKSIDKRPLQGLLNWYSIFFSSHHISFEDQLIHHSYELLISLVVSTMAFAYMPVYKKLNVAE